MKIAGVGVKNRVNTRVKTGVNVSPVRSLPVFKGHGLPETQLVNSIQLRDAKIKAFLLEIIEKNLSFSMREIAEELGFKNINSISKSIYHNPDIKELWDKVMQITKQKSEDIDNRIKYFLEEAVQTQTPTSAKIIADKVGINHAACRRRIRLNPELKELFEKRNEKPRAVKSKNALDLEEKIKQILEQAVENNEKVSAQKISKQFGLRASKIRDRIKRAPVLKALWDKLEHFKIPKKSQKVIEDNNKLRTILENALKSKQYLTIADIISLTGFTEASCLHRFARNSELKELWGKVNKANNSMQKNLNKIRDALLYAIRTKEYTTIADIGKRIGMNPNSVSSRFSYSPELKGLWMQVRENNKKCSKVSERIKEAKRNTKDIMTPDESKEVNELLKLTLETAIANNKFLDTAAISKNIGISKPEVSRRANLPEIRPLWERCKQIAVNLEEEKANRIAEFFEKAIAGGQVLTIQDASKAFDMKESNFIRFVYKNSRLTKLWNKIEHKSGSIKSLKVAEENKQIIEIMQNAIKNNQELILDDITQQTGVSVPALKHRIKDFQEIGELWEKVPRRMVYIEPKESVEKTERIKAAIEKRVSENKPFMLLEIAKEVNMDIPALYRKVRRTHILSDLWQNAEKKYVTDDSYELNRNIRDVLLDSIEQGIFVSAKDVAKKVNTTYETCIQRMRKNEELRELTQQLNKIRNNELKEEIKKLQKLLENAIETNTPITISQITELTGLNDAAFDYRMAHSKNLKSLWSKVKTIDVNILKQINKLTVEQNLSSEEIQKKLNLSDDKFYDLISKYERIKSTLTKNTNPLIKDDDILSWALLSKREFELAVREIFEKMGFVSQTTRYSQDKGIDVVASKDGKVTYMECMHNIHNATEVEELLALQGNKYYFNADNIIYVATSGITSFGQKFVDKIGSLFKILELEDLIVLAKKHKVDINNLKEKGDIKFQNNIAYGGKWKFVSKKKPEEVFEWRKLRQEEFEKRIKAIFEHKGYTVKCADDLNLSEYYVISKNNKNTVIKCINSNTQPTLDEIKALYGLKDYYDAEDVIFIAPSSISMSSKDFIDKINSNKETKNTYRLLNIDKVIDLYKEIRKQK